jgi:hypothetical protein
MIWDVYPGFQIRIFSIPDPGSRSETLDPNHPSKHKQKVLNDPSRDYLYKNIHLATDSVKSYISLVTQSH